MNIIFLSDIDRPSIKAHLRRLSPADRRLRFCSAISDYAIGEYVDHLDLWSYAAFGAYVDHELIAFVHLARGPGSSAELGISIDTAYRGRGLARQLLKRVHTFCLSHGVDEIYMACLRENQKMQHLARTEGLRLKTEDGETTAVASISATPAQFVLALYQELISGQVTIIDSALRATSNFLGDAA